MVYTNIPSIFKRFIKQYNKLYYEDLQLDIHYDDNFDCDEYSITFKRVCCVELNNCVDLVSLREDMEYGGTCNPEFTYPYEFILAVQQLYYLKESYKLTSFEHICYYFDDPKLETSYWDILCKDWRIDLTGGDGSNISRLVIKYENGFISFKVFEDCYTDDKIVLDLEYKVIEYTDVQTVLKDEWELY